MTGNLFNSPDALADDGWFSAHCDGGSRGNPGPSGYGAVIEGPDGIVAASLSKFLGIQTNNYAEYSGLLAVLEWALENGAKRLRVISDSELMVKQMQGKYKVASPVLRPLYEEARRRSRLLERFEMRHTLRGGNLGHSGRSALRVVGNRDSLPASETGALGAQGFDQAQVVENRRMELPRERMHILGQAHQLFLHRTEEGQGCLRRADVLLGHFPAQIGKRTPLLGHV